MTVSIGRELLGPLFCVFLSLYNIHFTPQTIPYHFFPKDKTQQMYHLILYVLILTYAIKLLIPVLKQLKHTVVQKKVGFHESSKGIPMNKSDCRSTERSLTSPQPAPKTVPEAPIQIFFRN